MINRIVRMSFKDEKINDFLEVFNESKILISRSNGCLSLKLLRDEKHKNIFFTYSVWENENCLEDYRNSLLFKNTWTKTKILFNDKALAWSTKIVDNVK